MTDYFAALLEYPLARHALWMSLLAGVACGIVGTYVVTRRITYIAAGVAHCVLGGLGAARYLSAVHGWTFLHPIHGALAAALAAAAVIGWVTLHAREREDTAIGAVWSLGMAAGILFIYKTPGYSQDLMSYLFGDILLVSTSDLWLVAALDLVIASVVVFFYPQLQAVCFDEEFARLRNMRVAAYSFLLLTLTALTVVLLVMVVGIVMVIALLTLPAAAAGRFSRSLAGMMIASSALCSVLMLAGLAASYKPDLPAGPVIIMITGAVYFASLGAGWIQEKRARRKSNSARTSEAAP